LIKLIITVAKKRGNNPFIVMLGLNLSSRKRVTMLITNKKAPRVKRIKGPKRNFNKGRMKKLIKVRIIAAIERANQSPWKIKPGTKRAAAQIAKALTITEKIIFPMNFTSLFYNFKLLISNTSTG
jgi:hypothetical protein